jgi:uncharacterized protein YodC (DUF2158 family)
MFSVGDLVRLLSGGPAMTIIDIASDGARVTCAWFVDGNGQYFQGEFNPAFLKPAPVATVAPVAG